MFKRFQEGTPKEKGQTLVLVAVMMMALLGLTAIAIDLSYVFVQRRDMQNAADAAALAGGRMVARFSANPTLHYRYRDVYYEVLQSGENNGAQNLEIYLVHCGDRQPYYELRPNDYGAIQRCPCACGVYVKAETSFDTFVSSLFGFDVLTASAEATAEFGLPKYATNVVPIGLRNTVLASGVWGKVGMTYTFWDSRKEGGSSAGWLGLDCKYPDNSSACDAHNNALKAWMSGPHYEGQVWYGDFVGGDPNSKNNILTHAQVGDTLIVPVFDYVYHFTKYRFCNPRDPKYNWSKCKANEKHEGTIPVYTKSAQYNNKYYYHIISFAAFEVTSKGKQQGDGYITGKFVSEVIASDWKCPTCPGHAEYANGSRESLGAVVVKLTQ